ncbi:hypothetical protein ACJX0J_027023, partial [Zea mays]
MMAVGKLHSFPSTNSDMAGSDGKLAMCHKIAMHHFIQNKHMYSLLLLSFGALTAHSQSQIVMPKYLLVSQEFLFLSHSDRIQDIVFWISNLINCFSFSSALHLESATALESNKIFALSIDMLFSCIDVLKDPLILFLSFQWLSCCCFGDIWHVPCYLGVFYQFITSIIWI